jgi:hypothetical protein
MSETKTTSQSFKSTADKAVVYALFLAFAAVLIFFLTYAVVKGETLTVGFLFFTSLSIGPLAGAAIFFVDISELLISDSGLARRICGVVCMQIPWDDIERIREIFRTKARNGPQIVIQVIPDSRGDVVLRFRRKLVVFDQIESLDSLIETLNARIDQHSIRVEISSNGVWRQRSKLAATPA